MMRLKGGKKASRSTRSLTWAGPMLVPLSGWPWPVMCLSVASTLLLASGRRGPCRPSTAALADLGAEVRVLAKGLFDAAPARVTRHVHHGRERQLCAGRAHLRGSHAEHGLHQFGVEAEARPMACGKLVAPRAT